MNMKDKLARNYLHLSWLVALIVFLCEPFDAYSQKTKKPVSEKSTSVVKSATPACELALKQLQKEIEDLRRQVSQYDMEKSKISETASVEIEAALVFQSRDIKPVARETFYLLKEDPASLILTKENYEMEKMEAAKEKLTKDMIASKFEAWNLKQATLYNSFFPVYQNAIVNILKGKAAIIVETGFDGKIKIDSLPIGGYYLFGIYHYGEGRYDFGIYLPQAAIWNLPITVKSGKNKIILDNKNSL